MTQRDLFLRYVAQTSDSPLLLNIDQADGIYLCDTDGKIYIDLIAGISVSNLGHCFPTVVEAIHEQAQRYSHLMVYGEYAYSPQVELAKLLCSVLPRTLDDVYFVNSGSEAVEGALKLAKRFTNRSELISCYDSYHGSTHGALSVSGNEMRQQAFRPLLPDVRHIHYNNLTDLQYITERTAAVIIEPVQAERGVVLPNKEFLLQLRQRCLETGALLILDEIQTGFGRTGTLFAFEQLGFVPDILLLGKAFGGGLPLGAFVANRRYMQCLTHQPVLGHITTFGGNALCCAASLATLKVLLTENYVVSVAEKAQIFHRLLSQHQHIKAFRQFGLLMAIELEDFTTTKRIIDRCIEKGLITDWFLFADNCLRIAPPLIITEPQIIYACRIIIEAIDEVVGQEGKIML